MNLKAFGWEMYFPVSQYSPSPNTFNLARFISFELPTWPLSTFCLSQQEGIYNQRDYRVFYSFSLAAEIQLQKKLITGIISQGIQILMLSDKSKITMVTMFKREG